MARITAHTRARSAISHQVGASLKGVETHKVRCVCLGLKAEAGLCGSQKYNKMHFLSHVTCRRTKILCLSIPVVAYARLTTVLHLAVS